MSVSITELIWQAKTQGKSIQEVEFFDVGNFQLNAYRVPKWLGPRLQFLWLPLDVKSLVFRHCFRLVF